MEHFQICHLHILLNEAFEAVEDENAFKALHKLNEITAYLDGFKNDYADVWMVHRNILAISKLYWRRKLDKGLALETLNNAIELCESWLERRAA